MILDKEYLLITYDDKLRIEELVTLGKIVNNIHQLKIIILKLDSLDTNGYALDLASRTRGVVRVSYNEKEVAEHFFHTSPSQLLSLDNVKIYDEVNLAAAHAITTGDIRVNGAVIDSGVSSSHPDISCVSGGVFRKGIYTANNGLPMKINYSEYIDVLATSHGSSIGDIVLYKYSQNRLELGESGELATKYKESTCTIEGTDTDGNFWIKEPVDILVYFMDVAPVWVRGVGLAAMEDYFGHGTAAVGIASEVAPNCTITAYKLTDDDGMVNLVDLVACLPYVADAGHHVISTSWGMSVVGPERQAAYNYLLSKGALWFASAGNDGASPNIDRATDYYSYPGAYPGVFCIGACGNSISQGVDTGYIDTMPDDVDYSRITYYSQKHDRVALLAPGYGWKVHAPMSGCNLWDGAGRAHRNWSNRRYTSQRTGGTSWATPFAFGAGLLMMSKIISGYSTTDPDEVRSILLAQVGDVRNALTSTANPTVRLANGSAASVGYGAGRIDIGAAVAAI